MQYINGIYYYAKEVSRTSIQLTTEKGHLAQLNKIFDTLRKLMSDFKVDIKPYNHEINRISIAKTVTASTFNTSFAEVKRLREHETTINKEAKTIIDKFIYESCQNGFLILKETLSSEFEYTLSDIYVDMIEKEINSLKKELSLARWVKQCDEILEKIYEQRLWKNASLSDIDSIVNEKEKEIAQIKNKKVPAKTEQDEIKNSIQELTKECQNLSFFSFSKKKSLNAEIDSLWQQVRELDSAITQQNKEQSDTIDFINKEIKALQDRKVNLKRWYSVQRYYELCIEILKEASEPISSEKATELLIAKDKAFDGFDDSDMDWNLILLSTIGVVNSNKEGLWSLADISEQEISDKIFYFYKPRGVK